MDGYLTLYIMMLEKITEALPYSFFPVHPENQPQIEAISTDFGPLALGL